MAASQGEQALEKQANFDGWSYQLGFDPDNQTIDCSHLVHQLFKSAGYDYTYCTANKFSSNSKFSQVSSSQVQKGDVIEFQGHVGIVESYSGSDTGTFYGSQSSTGPASANFGQSIYWGQTQKIKAYYRMK